MSFISNAASSGLSMYLLSSVCNLANSSLLCIISFAGESNQFPIVNFCFAVFLPEAQAH